ncbi:metal ABC transporter permease, partial [Faecalimonas umbilicata]|nr:metal ABC transporter permease [Faecalimonas umbilicata]
GLYISYYAETPASASITIIFVTVFLLISLVRRFIK